MMTKNESYTTDAAKLMDIADEYSRIKENPAGSRLVPLLTAASESLYNAEELARYERMAARTGAPKPRREVIQQVIEGEIEGAEQQTDAEIVSSWIQEIHELGDRYGLSPSLDSLYEYEEMLRTREHSPSTSIGSIDQGRTHRVQEESEIEEISTLFKRLAISD